MTWSCLPWPTTLMRKKKNFLKVSHQQKGKCSLQGTLCKTREACDPYNPPYPLLSYLEGRKPGHEDNRSGSKLPDKCEMVNTFLDLPQLTESSLHLSQVTASTSSGELTVLEEEIILGISLNLNFKYRSMQNSSGSIGSSYLLRWRLPSRVIQLARLSVFSSEEKWII